MYTDHATVIKNYLPMVDMTPLTSQSGFDINAFVDQMIVDAQQKLNDEMGQTLEQETLTDVRMDGAGSWELTLPHFPIQTLIACKVVYGYERLIYQFSNIRMTASRLLPAPYNVESNPIPPADLFVDRDSGVMHVDITGSLLSLAAAPGGYPIWNVTFTAGQRDVIAAYTHGFPPGQLPQNIVSACGMQAAIFCAEQALARATMGASSQKIGTTNRSWGGDSKMGSQFDRWHDFIDRTTNVWKVKPLGN